MKHELSYLIVVLGTFVPTIPFSSCRAQVTESLDSTTTTVQMEQYDENGEDIEIFFPYEVTSRPRFRLHVLPPVQTFNPTEASSLDEGNETSTPQSSLVSIIQLSITESSTPQYTTLSTSKSTQLSSTHVASLLKSNQSNPDERILQSTEKTLSQIYTTLMPQVSKNKTRYPTVSTTKNISESVSQSQFTTTLMMSQTTIHNNSTQPSTVTVGTVEDLVEKKSLGSKNESRSSTVSITKNVSESISQSQFNTTLIMLQTTIRKNSTQTSNVTGDYNVTTTRKALTISKITNRGKMTSINVTQKASIFPESIANYTQTHLTTMPADYTQSFEDEDYEYVEDHFMDLFIPYENTQQGAVEMLNDSHETRTSIEETNSAVTESSTKYNAVETTGETPITAEYDAEMMYDDEFENYDDNLIDVFMSEEFLSNPSVETPKEEPISDNESNKKYNTVKRQSIFQPQNKTRALTPRSTATSKSANYVTPQRRPQPRTLVLNQKSQVGLSDREMELEKTNSELRAQLLEMQAKALNGTREQLNEAHQANEALKQLVERLTVRVIDVEIKHKQFELENARILNSTLAVNAERDGVKFVQDVATLNQTIIRIIHENERLLRDNENMQGVFTKINKTLGVINEEVAMMWNFASMLRKELNPDFNESMQTVDTQWNMLQIKSLQDEFRKFKDKCEEKSEKLQESIKTSEELVVLNDRVQCLTRMSEIKYNNTIQKLKMVNLGGEYYYFSESGFTMTWYEAKQYCEENQLSFLSIETAEENELVIAHICGAKLPSPQWQGAYAWTGGSQLGPEGRFTWASTGNLIEYSDWQEGRPARGAQPRNCLALWTNDNGSIKWKDHPCEIKLRFVCEMDDVCNTNRAGSNSLPIVTTTVYP